MVKHIVMFKLNGDPELRHKVATRFAEALLALPQQIECLKSMEVGINENPSETWDIVLTAIVPTMEDVKVYATHPAHVAAAAIVAPHKSDRSCVDYNF